MSEAATPHRQRFEGVSEEAARAVADLIGAELTTEPYEPGEGETVYALEQRGPIGNLRLVLWPSLSRVDAYVGPHSWIAKSVVETEVIDGLEAIFRMEAGGMLFVALTGDVMLVAG